jgi:hypothetical protein
VVIGALDGTLTDPSFDLGFEPGDAGSCHTDTARKAACVFPPEERRVAHSYAEVFQISAVQHDLTVGRWMAGGFGTHWIFLSSLGEGAGSNEDQNV